jgi:adenylylsulfate reductase subunit B
MPVRINYHLCKGCKSCYNECPADVFGWDMDKGMPYLAYPDECWHCGICKLECPANALEHILPPRCWIDINKRFIANLNAPGEIKVP